MDRTAVRVGGVDRDGRRVYVAAGGERHVAALARALVWGAVAAGCAVVRAIALWGLRDEPDDDAFTGDLWVKLRTGAVWLLVTKAV